MSSEEPNGHRSEDTETTDAAGETAAEAAPAGQGVTADEKSEGEPEVGLGQDLVEESAGQPADPDGDIQDGDGQVATEADVSGRRVTRRKIRRDVTSETTSEVIEETINEDVPLLAYAPDSALHPAPVG